MAPGLFMFAEQGSTPPTDLLGSTGTPGPRQSLAFTIVKLVSFAAAGLLAAALGMRIAASIEDAFGVVIGLLGALVGYLVADFVSGTVHWFCDTFFSEDTPLLGPHLIQPFREHHTHPQIITQYSLLEQDGANYFILLPVLCYALFAGWPGGGAASLFVASILAGFAFGALCTNLFHRWAHASKVPPGVRWLQRRHLILSPGGHAIHHRSYTGGFCVTSGWLNPVLDRLGFYARLERSIRALTGTTAERH